MFGELQRFRVVSTVSAPRLTRSHLVFASDDQQCLESFDHVCEPNVDPLSLALRRLGDVGTGRLHG